MARRQRVAQLSVEQAAQALRLLIDQGRIRTQDIRNAFKRRDRLIRDLRSRLAELGAEAAAAGRRFGKRAAAGLRAAEKASRPARKRAKPKLSAATRKIYEMQGRYMAALRQLPKAARKQIKKIRATKGVRAAIAAAKRMAKKVANPG